MKLLGTAIRRHRGGHHVLRGSKTERRSSKCGLGVVLLTGRRPEDRGRRCGTPKGKGTEGAGSRRLSHSHRFRERLDWTMIQRTLGVGLGRSRVGEIQSTALLRIPGKVVLGLGIILGVASLEGPANSRPYAQPGGRRWAGGFSVFRLDPQKPSNLGIREAAPGCTKQGETRGLLRRRPTRMKEATDPIPAQDLPIRSANKTTDAQPHNGRCRQLEGGGHFSRWVHLESSGRAIRTGPIRVSAAGRTPPGSVHHRVPDDAC